MARQQPIGGWLRGVVKEAPSGDTLVISGAGAGAGSQAGTGFGVAGGPGWRHPPCRVTAGRPPPELPAVKSGIPPEKRLTLSSVIAPKLVSAGPGR